MNRILYLNGSPRKMSGSAQMLQDIAAFLQETEGTENQPEVLSLPLNPDGKREDILKRMEEADTWIIALPLYIDTLPGHLILWLREYEKERQAGRMKSRIRVYGIVNCGFPEAVQTAEALDILKIYCRKNSLDWRFGIGIGMGTLIKEMKNVPLGTFLKAPLLQAFRALAADLPNTEPADQDNRFITIRFPRRLYLFMGTIGWIRSARRNGVRRKDLFRRPMARP